MTHSWIALMKGDCGRAIGENALGPVLLAFSVVMAAAVAIRPRALVWNRFTTLLALGVLTAYAVARNLV
jgi:hypothetical protein